MRVQGEKEKGKSTSSKKNPMRPFGSLLSSLPSIPKPKLSHLLRDLALERRARQHVARGGQAQRAGGHGPPDAGRAGQQQQRRGGAPAGAALSSDGRRSAAVVALGVSIIVAVGLVDSVVGSIERLSWWFW